jgi:hypothetical protein
MSYLLRRRVKAHSQATAIDNKIIIHLGVRINNAAKNEEILMISATY